MALIKKLLYIKQTIQVIPIEFHSLIVYIKHAKHRLPTYIHFQLYKLWKWSTTLD